MASFLWDESYATGDLIVDDQHKQLFAMVQGFHDALVANTHKDLMIPTLERLAKYTAEHFAAEEQLMLQSNYPGYAKHKSRHEDLTRQALEVMEKYKSGQLTLPISVAQFLGNWLRHHIDNEDKKMIAWLKTYS